MWALRGGWVWTLWLVIKRCTAGTPLTYCTGRCQKVGGLRWLRMLDWMNYVHTFQLPLSYNFLKVWRMFPSPITKNALRALESSVVAPPPGWGWWWWWITPVLRGGLRRNHRPWGKDIRQEVVRFSHSRAWDWNHSICSDFQDCVVIKYMSNLPRFCSL